jgi:carboxyl-terminal processing protease
MTKLRKKRFAIRVFTLMAILTVMPLLVVSVHAASGADRVRSRMMEILNEVAADVKQNYYDPTLKGVDWKSAVEVARERIRRAEDEGEMAAAISGLLARLDDSHTYFLRPTRLQPVIFGFRAKAFGDDVRIYEIMPGGPAEQAGLQRGDKVVGVEGFAATRELIDEEVRYFEYLDPHLTMKLKIVRDGGAPTDYVINGKQPATSSKEFVKLHEKYAEEEVKEDEGVKVRQEDGGVAYLRFPSFMVTTSKAASLLKGAKDAQALVLDLRDDGGGREDTMKEMVGHFLSQSTQLLVAISREKKKTSSLNRGSPT